MHSQVGHDLTAMRGNRKVSLNEQEVRADSPTQIYGDLLLNTVLFGCCSAAWRETHAETFGAIFAFELNA